MRSFPQTLAEAGSHIMEKTVSRITGASARTTICRLGALASAALILGLIQGANAATPSMPDATQDSAGWSQPEVHRALLVSGLSVLTSATWLLRRDLNGESAEAA